MKKLTLDEWENEYIAGPIERFDQKYTMGRRGQWDESFKERMKELTARTAVSDEPGWTLVDWAMRVASRSIVPKLELMNQSKPNQGDTSLAPDAFAAIDKRLRPPAGAGLNTNDPKTITNYIKKAATYFGADMVGICKLDHRWVYSHTCDTKKGEEGHKPQEIGQEYQYAIVIACGGGYNLRRHFPTYINTWTTNSYRQMMTNALLSAFIKCLGFKTIDCTFDDVALAVPLAMQAGLGQLGRHGMLITPRYGSSVRIGQIFTDIPLVQDEPIDFGVTEFCNACKKCADACPSHSITHTDRSTKPVTVSNADNELKWQFNPETCHMNLYGHAKPCQICVSVCPFTKPHTPFHRMVKWCVDKARWANPLYVKMDSIFGYDKPKKSDNFWDNWKPENYQR
ncbi:MAG: reductive dehalogenase [Chloroflexi bacterium]|jgi:reductive dehalogenase|nr:reductive dehalogenase [Chloroflexota bacterium]MBT7290373.1 reductive dehalogenase [Chloroflexota bacterium]